MGKAEDLYAKITATLIEQLESADPAKWERPWTQIGWTSAPESVEGRKYRGLNSLWLSLVAQANGYTAGQWGTYKAWKKYDGQVRKGEKGTEVLLWKPIEVKDENAPNGKKKVLIARTYNVFAAEQVDGAEKVKAKREPKELDTVEAIAHAEEFFDAVGAVVNIGGDRAYYSPVHDEITVPTLDQFKSAPDFYSTLGHEHVHWSGHKDRLDRDLKGRFGDESYAAEELVAEIGSAFLSGHLDLTPEVRGDHAHYLKSWLKVLKGDDKAILTATSKAQKAVDYIIKLAAGEEIELEAAA